MTVLLCSAGASIPRCQKMCGILKFALDKSVKKGIIILAFSGIV